MGRKKGVNTVHLGASVSEEVKKILALAMELFGTANQSLAVSRIIREWWEAEKRKREAGNGN